MIQNPPDPSIPICSPRPGTQRGKAGWYVRIWAPEAASVSVAGTFNQWQPDAAFLMDSGSGWWTGFLSEAEKGAHYQLVLHTQDGETLFCADPWAIAVEPPPGTACRLWDFSGCRWQDEAWFRFRRATSSAPELLYHADLTHESPVNAAAHLIPKLKRLGYTGAVLSIGLGRATTFFAPCAGWLPEDLAGLIDQFHRAGLSVFLDWDPTHCVQAYAPTPLVGCHTPSSVGRLDWSCPEVRRFLICSAQFWATTYHLDGLRILANTPDFYLPGRGSNLLFDQLQRALAHCAPTCQLVLRSPMPLECFGGRAERSAQPLVDLFLHRTAEPDQSLAEDGLRSFTWADGDPASLRACYLAFLALPGGKLTALRDNTVLPESFLQRAHQFYLEEPLLWPPPLFRWAAPPSACAPLIAFWRGCAGMRQLLCLCNPTGQFSSLTLPVEAAGQFHLLFSSQDDCWDSIPDFIVPEQAGSEVTFSLPPLTCALFDYLPAAFSAGSADADTMGRILR